MLEVALMVVCIFRSRKTWLSVRVSMTFELEVLTLLLLLLCADVPFPPLLTSWRSAGTRDLLDLHLAYSRAVHVLLEFAREVRRQNGRKITVGTQTLDKCWDYCKDFIPNSVHTKNAKNKLLNAEIWNHVYQWHWRYNHRHALRQMVPKVPTELCT